MKVVNEIGQAGYDRKTCITIGVFDGFHLGHRELVQRLLECSKREKTRSIILTFSPHPKTVIGRSDQSVELITTLEEKKELISKFSVDVMIVIPFTIKFARTEPEDFIRMILDQIGCKKIFLGHNHAFGRDRVGGENLLVRIGKKDGFQIEVIPPVKWKGQEISSTRIRQYLQEGDVSSANAMLGWKYSIHGVVKQGHGRGKGLGFPTANLEVCGENKLIPRNGVYAVLANFKGSEYPGMAYIGHNPTFHGRQRNVEVNLHSFHEDICNQHLSIMFIEWIREEKKFDTADDLVDQMHRDKNRSIELLGKN